MDEKVMFFGGLAIGFFIGIIFHATFQIREKK
jgi:hypothetical protein